MTGYGTIAGTLVNDATIQGSGGLLSITGSATNNGTMRFATGSTLVATGRFINNRLLYLRAGGQTVPALLVNNGLVMDTSSVSVTGFTKVSAALKLTYNSLAGKHYQLQRSDTFAPGLWHNVVASQLGTGGPLTVTDPTGVAAAKTRFYRILQLP